MQMNWHDINEKTKRLKSEWAVSVKKSDRMDSFWSVSAKIVFILNIFAPVIIGNFVGVRYSQGLGVFAYIASVCVLIYLMWFCVRMVNRRKYK